MRREMSEREKKHFCKVKRKTDHWTGSSVSSLRLCGRNTWACLDVALVTRLPGAPTQLYPLNRGLSPAEWDRRPRRIKARSYGNVLGAGAGPTQEANRGAAIITPITQTRETEAQ